MTTSKTSKRTKGQAMSKSKGAYLMIDGAISLRELGKVLGMADKSVHNTQKRALEKISAILDSNPALKESLRSYL